MNSLLLRSQGKIGLALGVVALLAGCGPSAPIACRKNAASLSLDSVTDLFIQAASPYAYDRPNAVIVTAEVLGDSVSIFLEYRPPFNQSQPSKTALHAGHCIYYYYKPNAEWLFDSATGETCAVVGVDQDVMLDWYTWELELGADSIFHLIPHN